MKSKTPLLAGMLLAFAPSAFGLVPLFESRMHYRVHSTTSIAVADLNNDGFNDFVVPYHDWDSLNVFFNNGDGSFMAAANCHTNRGPWNIALADYDGDIDVDIAVTNGPGSALSIFINNGNGSFQPRMDYFQCGHAYSICSADLDNDNDRDIITGDYYSDTIAVFKNNGDGTFQESEVYEPGYRYETIEAADIDGDGDNDFVVTSMSESRLLLFINNGQGQFGTPRILAEPSPSVFTIRDIDNDSDKDILFPYAHNISILHNIGNGIFLPPANIPIGVNAYDITTADFDNDLHYDIAATIESGNVMTMRNNGDGSYGTMDSFPVAEYTDALCVADFDNDGYVDIGATASINLSHPVAAVFFNRGNGAFPVPRVFALGGPVTYMEAIDLNGDDHTDIVLNTGDSTALSRMINNGNMTFTPGPDIELGFNPEYFGFGDFNGDHFSDMAVARWLGDGSTVSIMRNNGNGEFQHVNDWGAFEWIFYISPTDIDSDGDCDMVIVDNYTDQISILKNNGANGFDPQIDFDVDEEPMVAKAADLNGDQLYDVVVACYYWINVFINNGSGSFLPRVRYEANNYACDLTISDLDNDNDNDIAAVLRNASCVIIYLNNGNGNFTLGGEYYSDQSPSSISSMDFDNDGDCDLAVTNIQTYHFSIMLNNGNGTFQYPISFGAPRSPKVLATDDFDGDGDFDIVTANGFYSPCLSAFENNTIITDATDETPIISKGRIHLSPNYPNPFNAKTMIEFTLPVASHARIDVFDIAGRKVGTAAEEDFPAGANRVTWDTGGLGSGVYFYRIIAGEYSDSRKMLLIK